MGRHGCIPLTPALSQRERELNGKRHRIFEKTHLVCLAMMLALVACGPSSRELKQLQESRRQLQEELAQARKAADPDAVYDLPTGNSPFQGPVDAPVVVTVFADFASEACAVQSFFTKQLIKQHPNEIKYVFKNFPLTEMHPDALAAARAALAAHKQGKFWEMHDKLLVNRKAFQPEKLREYARDFGLDVVRFDQDMQSPEVEQQINADLDLARQAAVKSVPTAFVNGKRLTRGDDLKRALKEATKPKGG